MKRICENCKYYKPMNMAEGLCMCPAKGIYIGGEVDGYRSADWCKDYEEK